MIREQIEVTLRQVLHEDAIAEWWGTYLPTFQRTAEQQYERDPEKLLVYVDSYFGTSYS